MNGPPQPLDPIDQAAVDDVTEPILRELEQTAVASAHMRFGPDDTSSPPAPRRRPAETVFDLVDLGLRVMERLASKSRDLAAELLDVDPDRGPQPAPTTATASSSARGGPGPSSRRSVASALVTSGTPIVPDTTSPASGVRPGQVVEVELVVKNRTARPLYSLRFRSTDLIRESGNAEARIPASVVAFEPLALNLAPRATAGLKARVAVPPGTARGRYAGRVTAVGIPELHTVVEVKVG